MKTAGITWDASRLDAYLANPQQGVPGNTMPFSGLADAGQLTRNYRSVPSILLLATFRRGDALTLAAFYFLSLDASQQRLPRTADVGSDGFDRYPL
ncbi:hypothetical protein PQR71_37995 [Paraburkholderia fungorum]|uniref:c-type cytochrome n=1 Tax=Paraburkholderia fungorum TaxID=134537 RepID=UPI0038BC778C